MTIPKQCYSCPHYIPARMGGYGPDETEFPYNQPANTLEGEIKNIWSKLSSENAFVASFEGFREVILHFVNFVQKVQKPAEWSEEDEKMLASFLHKVEVCDLLTNKENVWIVKRLKSLRPKPHWKPSEEQMRAFEIAKKYTSIHTSDEWLLNTLESIFNDLKNLM